MNQYEAAKDLARSVLDWWDEHKDDTYTQYDGEYAESYNTYTSTPAFVVKAANFLGRAL